MSILRADDKKYEFSVDIETWSDNMGQIKKNYCMTCSTLGPTPDFINQ